MRVLAGDVGGTKTALALYERAQDGSFQLLHDGTYASTAYSSFAEVLQTFLRPVGSAIAAAGIGVAGPVQDGAAATTNLPWTMSERELSDVVRAPVGLINDFHAVALGVMGLASHELRVLQEGERDPRGPVAVIGAGTGLGEALCVPTASGVHVVASEGGHASFAPCNELELRLLEYLLTKHHHVSVERVVSGLGFRGIYEFVVAQGLAPPNADTLRRFEVESVGAVLGARSSQDPAAELTLETFVSAYGSEAGNLALKTLPTGGLFIAGGIAPRMLDRLSSGVFMERFRSKGRMRALLGSIPVAVVLHPNVGLLGARTHALAVHDRPRS
jgi:glucokinase